MVADLMQKDVLETLWPCKLQAMDPSVAQIRLGSKLESILVHWPANPCSEGSTRQHAARDITRDRQGVLRAVHHFSTFLFGHLGAALATIIQSQLVGLPSSISVSLAVKVGDT
jgi:hypothetical protein